MTENLIETLNKQHNKIKEEMLHLEREASKVGPDYDVLLAHMKEFGDVLLEHLALEDAEFYPALEKKLLAEHEDPTEIIEFGKKMVALSIPVEEFLEKYSTRESIAEDLYRFRRDLVDIMTQIFMRISSENVFVHSQWINHTK
ncbi:hemerythrin domain-containing protein [Patescibacteria group bacterium]